MLSKEEGSTEKYCKEEISLPDYVDALATDFTVHVTPMYDDEHEPRFTALCASDAVNGKFTVCGKEPGPFSWVVYGKRSNVEVEPNKSDVTLHGDGPYTWLS